MSESELREMLAKTAGAAIRVFINGEDIKALLDDLSTLRARVAEVEREASALAAVTCHDPYGDAWGNMQCGKVDAMRKRAEAAESRLLPQQLSDEQREMLARALHAFDEGNAGALFDDFSKSHQDAQRANADRFHAILTRIEGERHE